MRLRNTSFYFASIVARQPIGIRCSGTELKAAVGKRHDDRSDLDFGDSFLMVDTDFFCGGWGEVDDATSI